MNGAETTRGERKGPVGIFKTVESRNDILPDLALGSSPSGERERESGSCSDFALD